jgi:leucyl/phenylalanyl-tRNA---protein transferase
MPVFLLNDQLIFPDPLLAENGVLAIGGDLSPDRLLLAYSNGIFPWYSEGEPIIWHAPDPRFVLFPKKFKVSKTMRKLIDSNKYTCTVNTDFLGVIKNCKDIQRKDQESTWITDEMVDAYYEMHKLGFAYSVEVRNKHDELVGGLYGIKIGKVFFGESMFSKEPSTSKVAMNFLVTQFELEMIDAQVYTEYLESLGGEFITMEEFLFLLSQYTDE